MAKNLSFGSFSRETFWQNGGHGKWPLWGPSPRSIGQKFIFCQFFSENILAKCWPSEVATLGTLPGVKWPKIDFLAVFLGKHSDEMVAIGSGHFGDPPRGQMAKKLFFGSFSRETFWQNGSHEGSQSGHFPWPPFYFPIKISEERSDIEKESS
jgi:hypothetical protein